MIGTVFISAASRSRLEQARAWLGARGPAEELLIVGASLAAANELARNLAHMKGVAFGWHRSTLARLAAELAAPALNERGLVPITRLGSEALIARLVQQRRLDGMLGRYSAIAQTPGFARAMASAIVEVQLATPPEDAVAARARDLAELAAAYTAELGEIAVTDWPATFALAAEH